MRIVTIVGARPQFIKAAAFSRVAHKMGIEEKLVHTGQHYDINMSEVFFRELQIPKPAYNLGVSGGSHAKMTGAMMSSIESVLEKELPDYTLVYGDTNSTMAGALASVKLHIPVIHIEAGLRLGSLDNPEEVNRIVTDHVSTLRFAPTSIELSNLTKENLATNSYVVGNIMFDSYLHASSLPFSRNTFNLISARDGATVALPGNYYLLTCHRQENTADDSPMTQILSAMNSLDYPTIYPVHPRNRERCLRLCKDNSFNNILLIEPVGYIESINLLKNCQKVVTDSGGLQCEAFYAKKQCVTVFDYMVWPQLFVGCRNQLSAPNKDEILQKLSVHQVIDDSYLPFGSGDTAQRIVEEIQRNA